jgi:hypothetical protein
MDDAWHSNAWSRVDESVRPGNARMGDSKVFSDAPVDVS